MFERYTERARRVVFFARYEASEFGSPEIEAPFLLLGLLRECKDFIARDLKPDAVETIRSEIQNRQPSRPKISTSVDLPLSAESKRVLGFAADEAGRLDHKYIGTEHILVGLLREEGSLSAELLRRYGLTIEQQRSKLAHAVQCGSGRDFESPRRTTTMWAGKAIEIHGSQWNTEFINSEIAKLRAYPWHWQKCSWKARDLVVHRRDGKVSFDLSLAEDTGNFGLVSEGWKTDRCAVCRWELFETEDIDHGIGYTNGRQWLCTECYRKFFEDPEFLASTYGEIT